ncbi:1,2-phenylacetyl-CoA epoxidase subunit PaaD [Blastococcus sp. SYSU D00922]
MSGRTLRRTGRRGDERLDPRPVAEAVVDPELPVLTLADLGVLRDVRTEADGTVVVEITPTYSGCPAIGVMRADLLHALHDAGFERVDVRTVLWPAWSTDWISAEGRRKLAQAGIAPPGAAPARPPGPVPLDLGRPRRTAACPLCGSADTEEVSEFGATACTALRRCRQCREPFEHVKEI